ncbi:hypothetical protein PTSG_05329 [Salpingoeca rosetta]|uniref:Uncharacterized protein n=1 Tax=Salpingoeca rosetta (strain ATCC 50818 / BSB-021) TaxID=946362 RepID=F2UA46_SALR5|nr:uncharacterized protein PTSG_05329 [Salpingoeca rosetta]EGD73621.1 hypothetical protein PTSG_05329 [Salpingoeca rosetta]|eukprot:XP_004993902.1 hypothetical protein PTSG_05329 [Salpingoeca rosetta]
MQGLLVGSALLAQAMLLQWTQPYTLLHSFVAVPFSFVAFTVGFFFLAKTFLVTPLFFLPAILIAKVTNTDQQLQEFLAASEASDADVNRIKIPTPDGLSMSRAAQVILPQVNGLMSAIFAGILGLAAHTTIRFSAFADDVPRWSVTIATITIALAVRHLRLLFPLVPLFMRAAGWQLDAVDTFDVNRSFCIYHPRDEVLPHRLSDAFSVLQQQHTDALRSFELSGAHPSLPCHMYPLHEHDDEWAQLLALLRSFVHD